MEMPFSILTDEQILELLAEQPKMERVPGVALVWADFIGSGRAQVAIVVSVYAGDGHGISQLPVTVAGLPVVVQVENPQTMQVVEIVDPRQNGGAWPRTNREE